MAHASPSDETAAAVLVVDDTPANLLAVQPLLKPLGYPLVMAASGYEALKLAAERDFVVILLDLMMPELDGLATLQRMRAIPRAKTTPVVLLTAFHPERRIMESAYALGALDFVEKPIAPELLRGKVKAFAALYEQGRQLRRHAEALRAKDRQLGVLAHDLRTPLSVIATGGQLLARHDDASVQQTAQRVVRAAGRMERLIEDLLQFALAAEEHFVLKPERVDLSALCHELIEDMQAVFPRVTISQDIFPGLIGEWDAARLHQALANLLGNAVKHGTGWVMLRLASVDEGWVEVAVDNTCDVIAPERLEQLFAPFVRGGAQRDGVGLGLYVVREIARAHGGEVLATSDARRTSFRLRLPLEARTP